MSNERNIMRAFIDSVFPEGSAWRVMPDGDLDNLLQGMSLNSMEVKALVDTVKYVRDPWKTTLLCDLEKEFGIICDTRISEDDRRQRLASRKYSRGGKATKDDLQSALRNAGFDCYVHINNPPVDPATFLNSNFLLIAGGTNAYAGEPTAVAGFFGGELLVNGDLFTQSPLYLAAAGLLYAGAGVTAGQFDEYRKDIVNYQVPTDPDNWHDVFFVGGAATRDGVTGELLTIAKADIPNERKYEFRETILRLKPVRTWAGLIVEYN